MVSSEADKLQGWHDPAGVLASLTSPPGCQRLALNALESCLEDPARDRIISAGNPLSNDGFFPASSGRARVDSVHISAYDCPPPTGEGAEPASENHPHGSKSRNARTGSTTPSLSLACSASSRVDLGFLAS